MKRKSMFYILAFVLLFSQFVPSIAMATELPETTIEQEQVAEQQKEINTDIEQVEQKEEESKQEITDQKTEQKTEQKSDQKTELTETETETEETKVHSEPVNENPTLTDQVKEEEKVKTASEEKNQPLEAPGPNYLLEDFESGLGSWAVSSARANSVNVSISDEVARFGKHSLKIDYDFTNQPGTSGVYANIGEAIEIPGHPKKISMWVYGDGEKHWLRQILYDANGENFNIDYTPSYPNGVTWEGWKYVEAEIPSNWKPPFKLGNEAIRYMATSEEAKGKATIYIDNIRAIYEDVEEDTTNPTISNLSPSDEQLVYSNQPEIAVHVSDDQSGLDFSKTEMTLDGKPVEPTINEEVGTISYTPVKPLAEGLHKVWVNVADKEGNHSFTTWTFTVEAGGPAIDWDVDEDIYAGSQFTANMTVKHVKQFAGMTFNIQYDAKRLTLVDMNPDKEGIQVSIPEKLQSAVSHHKVDPEAGIIEIAFDQMNKIDLKEEETVIGLTYSLGLDASGDFTLNLNDGQYFYADQPAEAVPFFLPAFKGHISQPLKLTLTGLSQATPTTMKVVDKNDQPVSGASISVLGDQKLIKVMKPTSIYKGGSGVAGEPYEPLEVGTLIPVAQTPYDGFDFYRIFMPNGEQRYYHVPMEDVEEVDWGSIFGKTNDQGIIETDQLTLSRIPLKLQAVKGNLVSQVESFTISPHLGKNAPEHITLTWTNDSKTTQHFTWKTDTFTEGSVVEVNPVNVKSEKLIFKGTTTLFGDQTGEMNLHKVEATGLQPGTTYEYRVGDGSGTGWSEYSTFTTEAANNDPFRFMFVADSQAYDKEGFKLTSDLLDLGLNKFPDMKFVVHAGDIVEEGDKLPQWEDFKEATKGVSSKLPLMMLLGNHDVYGDGANIFKNLYSYPQNGPAGKEGFVYSFDYGKARFLMLNSEFGIQDMKEQEEWIREEVRSAGDKWIIAMFHRSPYKSNPKRGEDATQTIFAPLLEELQVDLVLTRT